MTYEETLHYLFTSTPVYQHSGATAYKPGLGTSIALDDHLGNPHTSYRTIHVAGTNGKGSVSHLLAAILGQAGYKVGLYTSPHLLDFRERIRVNGKKISKEYVIGFVERHRAFFEPLHPSFFELTSTMAFDYFRTEKVDFAIIEVGMGGRLDSTNIITPILSVITNISLDHTQFLGDTEEKIAAEKAGIIKKGVPVLLGEAENQSVRDVIADTAANRQAPFYFAKEMGVLNASHKKAGKEGIFLDSESFGLIYDELGGIVQCLNGQTVLSALQLLQEQGIKIATEAVHDGFGHVVELTGLMGRWQTLQSAPHVICDTGHNVGGWQFLTQQMKGTLLQKHKRIHLIIGMVNDKDIDGILSILPPDANYFFTQASVERALPAAQLTEKAAAHGLKGTSYGTVEEAIKAALSQADDDDLVFIGGSNFVVADAIPFFSVNE